jgi:amino acid transporter
MITITLLWPGICSFVYMFGLIGAAIPRLIISFITTFILSAVIIRKFLKGEFRKWLLEDTMVPVIVSFIVTFLLYHLFLLFPQGYLTIVYGTVIGGVIIFFHGIIFIRRYPDFKTRLMSFGKSFIRYQN